MTISNAIRTIALATIASSAAFALLELGLLAREARLKLDLVAGQFGGLIRPTQQLEANWSAVALTSAQVLAKERAAFQRQDDYYVQLADRTGVLLDSANQTVLEVNHELLPDLRASVDSGNAAFIALGDATRELAQSGTETLRSADTAIGAVQADAESVEPILDNTATVTANLAGITGNAEKISDHYTALILKPASKIKAGVLFAASIAGRILRIL